MAQPETLPADIRTPVLNLGLVLASIAGTANFTLNLLREDGLRASTPGFWAIAVSLVALDVAAVWRRGPVVFRGGSLYLFFTAAALAALAYTGGTAEAALFLTFGVLLVGLLFGRRLLALAYGLAMACYFAAGYGWVSGHLPLPGPFAAEGRPEVRYWIAKGAGFAAGCGVIVILVGALVRQLRAHDASNREKAAALAREQAHRGRTVPAAERGGRPGLAPSQRDGDAKSFSRHARRHRHGAPADHPPHQRALRRAVRLHRSRVDRPEHPPALPGRRHVRRGRTEHVRRADRRGFRLLGDQTPAQGWHLGRHAHQELPDRPYRSRRAPRRDVDGHHRAQTGRDRVAPQRSAPARDARSHQ